MKRQRNQRNLESGPLEKKKAKKRRALNFKLGRKSGGKPKGGGTEKNNRGPVKSNPRERQGKNVHPSCGHQVKKGKSRGGNIF